MSKSAAAGEGACVSTPSRTTERPLPQDQSFTELCEDFCPSVGVLGDGHQSAQLNHLVGRHFVRQQRIAAVTRAQVAARTALPARLRPTPEAPQRGKIKLPLTVSERFIPFPPIELPNELGGVNPSRDTLKPT